VETGFAEMKSDFEAMRKEVLTTVVRERVKHRYGSLLSLSSLLTYDGDNKETWIEFRTELIERGFRSQTLDKHKDILIAYMMKLERSGILDKTVQASAPFDSQQMPWWMKHIFMETTNSLPDLDLPERASPETEVATSKAALEAGKPPGLPPPDVRMSVSWQQGTHQQEVASPRDLPENAGPRIAIDAPAKSARRE
jgi:hypothetical protein